MLTRGPFPAATHAGTEASSSGAGVPPDSATASALNHEHVAQLERIAFSQDARAAAGTTGVRLPVPSPTMPTRRGRPSISASRVASLSRLSAKMMTAAPTDFRSSAAASRAPAERGIARSQ